MRIISALAVTLAAVLVAACTAPRTTPLAQNTPIAWLDAPTAPPTAPGPPTPAAARTCTAADLPATTTFREGNGISQSVSYIVELRNVGPSACTLDTRPQLTRTDVQGQTRTVPTAPWGTSTSPATIAPGETASVLIVWQHGCDGATLTYEGISLVEAGKRIAVPGLTLSGTCPTVALGMWQPPQEADPTPPPLRFGTVGALLDAPATAHAGETLDYVVTLTNPSQATLPLAPCPVYREMIYKQMLTYLLNCPAAGLPAGGSVRFAMRIAVPDYTPTGHYRLQWMIVEAGGESAAASAPVDVTPAA
jgi:hypothetical protein